MLCPGRVVGHETKIGDSSILAPGSIVSGLVEVGSSCYIGAAPSSVRNSASARGRSSAWVPSWSATWNPAQP